MWNDRKNGRAALGDPKVARKRAQSAARRRNGGHEREQFRERLEAEAYALAARKAELTNIKIFEIDRSLMRLSAQLANTPSLNGTTPPPKRRQREAERQVLFDQQASLEAEKQHAETSFNDTVRKLKADGKLSLTVFGDTLAEYTREPLAPFDTTIEIITSLRDLPHEPAS